MLEAGRPAGQEGRMRQGWPLGALLHQPSVLLCPLAGGPLPAEEWAPHHPAGRGPAGQPGLCDGASQLRDEQLFHQPGVGPD